jgi:hypothetical protein
MSRSPRICDLLKTSVEGMVWRIGAKAWAALTLAFPAGVGTLATAQDVPAQAQSGSGQDAKHSEDLKRDVELGKKVAAEVEKELKVSKNQEMIDRVNRVAADILKIANTRRVKVLWGDPRLNPFEYKFTVVEGKDINAFSLPGGFIFIYEGLLKYVESDDELAGVLAHEISHCSFRHLATLSKEQSKFNLLTLPLVLAAIFSGSDVGYGAVALRDLAGIAKQSGWSQQAETAADYGAFQYLVQTQYNPVGMLTFMERLARDQRGLESIDWGIFRTHPPSKERAEAMTARIKEAGIAIRRSLVSTSFRVIATPSDMGGIELSFNGKPLVVLAGDSALARADEAQARLNEFFDQVPELYEVRPGELGEIVGRKRTLVRLTLDDANAVNVSLPELQETTIRAVKRSLFMLAFRIWDAR